MDKAASCSSITADKTNGFQILKPRSTLIEITKWPPFFKKYEALRAKILACTIEYPLTIINQSHSQGDTMPVPRILLELIISETANISALLLLLISDLLPILLLLLLHIVPAHHICSN